MAAKRPTLHIVDREAPAPRLDPLISRMMAAADPGDLEALLLGLIGGVLLVAALILVDNATLIESWLRG